MISVYCLTSIHLSIERDLFSLDQLDFIASAMVGHAYCILTTRNLIKPSSSRWSLISYYRFCSDDTCYVSVFCLLKVVHVSAQIISGFIRRNCFTSFYTFGFHGCRIFSWITIPLFLEKDSPNEDGADFSNILDYPWTYRVVMDSNYYFS